MSTKFIPNGDFDFVMMAEHFARCIAAEPQRFAVAVSDAEALSTAAANFRAALMAARGGSSRSAVATRAKEDARAVAEKIVRKLAAVIRVNEAIDAASKVLLGLKERPAKVKQQLVPAQPPMLKFVRALHEGNGAVPVHELAFGESFMHRNRRPAGAVRLELFVDLLHPDEEIPAHPGANHGGRPWYLRSFSRSPIKLTPPMTRSPMRVVYWGRWADSMGNVGPFSATAVGWVEGASMHRMGVDFSHIIGGYKRPALMEEATAPAGREQTISVLVMEAQYQSMHPQMMPAIAGSEPRRLEGQRGEEAA